MEAAMHRSNDFHGTEHMDCMDYEAWRDLMRPLSGHLNVEGVEPDTFAGWLRP
jgi:hypothetical protein